MYLVDTNVIGEARKGARADPGVRAFLEGQMPLHWPMRTPGRWQVARRLGLMPANTTSLSKPTLIN